MMHTDPLEQAVNNLFHNIFHA